MYSPRPVPGSRRQRLWAVALWSSGGVISHHSAAWLWGIPVPVDEDHPCDGGRSPLSQAGERRTAAPGSGGRVGSDLVRRATDHERERTIVDLLAQSARCRARDLLDRALQQGWLDERLSDKGNSRQSRSDRQLPTTAAPCGDRTGCPRRVGAQTARDPAGGPGSSAGWPSTESHCRTASRSPTWRFRSSALPSKLTDAAITLIASRRIGSDRTRSCCAVGECSGSPGRCSPSGKTSSSHGSCNFWLPETAKRCAIEGSDRVPVERRHLAQHATAPITRQ